jgi:hypothetical protein
MGSIKTKARQAGVLYVLLAVTGYFNDVYVPGAFIVAGDATTTARNITTAPLIYRLGILSGLASNIIFLCLGFSLYNLLRDVDRKEARLMMILVSAGAAVALANLFNQMAPLVLLSGADFLSVFTKPQLDALALAFLRLRNNGTYVAMAFWALWLLPFGVLVIKSGFFPKFLGVLLIIGCFAYLTVSATSIALPSYSRVVMQVMLPFFMVGELSMIVWLLVKGAKVPSPAL